MTSAPLLDEIKVLELSRVLAGPWCAMMLGDLGADVIKVERPQVGDDTRTWGPPFAEDGQSAYFLCANRNKRSIELDIKSPRGLETLEKLIARSDVLIDNFRVGRLEAIGLTKERLAELRPDLIHCSISAFGREGPYAKDPGYDFLIQARGGLMSITGPPGSPHKVGVAVCDLAAGQNATVAILAALFARERHGGGQRIDVSLFDSQLSMLANVASNHLVSGDNPAAYGNGHANIVPYQALEASDGPIAIGVGNDAQWRKFCEAVQREDWAADVRFATNAMRVIAREELTELLGDLFALQTRAHWLALFESLSIPCAPIQSVSEVFRDSRAAHMLVEVGGVPMVNSPLSIPTAPIVLRLPPPHLGEHTAEILAELA
jgi:crotonobetainyl-CoA:carnitine CoA-transferase CaiB-like acyl-CoA transferase